jgi:hypothetical protein
MIIEISVLPASQPGHDPSLFRPAKIVLLAYFVDNRWSPAVRFRPLDSAVFVPFSAVCDPLD